MTGEPQVDMITFNRATDILGSGITVAGNFEDGSKGEEATINGGGAVTRF